MNEDTFKGIKAVTERISADLPKLFRQQALKCMTAKEQRQLQQFGKVLRNYFVSLASDIQKDLTQEVSNEPAA